MQISTSVALSRLSTESQVMDIIANNIANVDTIGFKREAVQFSTWMSKQSGANSPPGGQQIAYTQDRATYRDWRQGAFTQTGNPLDLAIGSQGFFTVATPNGPRLTRDGHFTLSPTGTITDMDGDALLDTKGKPIKLALSDTHITIAGDGTISTANGVIGKVGVVVAKNPNLLVAEGSQKLRANTPTTLSTNPRILQGALEESNVQPIVAITNMLQVQHDYDLVAKLVQAESTRRQSAIDKTMPTTP